METRTKTATKPELEAELPTERNEVAVFQPPRLPYHHAVKERFGVEPSGWKALVEAIYPNAKSVDAVVMALSYCKARGLDPFKRPVHIVPMWDSKSGGYVETIWPGIAELRTTAFRTKQYAGCDEAEFGDRVEKTFTGKVKAKGGWEDKTLTVEFPEWCRITVYRDLGGRVCKFVGPKVKWLESYATIGRSELPNDMWESRPEGQLEKCAEAAALRKAFPEELGNDLTAEEMAGRTIHDDDRGSTTDRMVRTNDGPPPPTAVSKGERKPAPPIDADVELVEAGRDNGEQVEWSDADTSTAPLAPDDEYANWRKDAEGALTGCTDSESFFNVNKTMIAPAKGKVSAADWQAVALVSKQTFDRLSMAD